MSLQLTGYIRGTLYTLNYSLPGFVRCADSDSRKRNICQAGSPCSYRYDDWSLIPLTVNNADEITGSNRGQKEGHGPEQPADKKDVHGPRNGNVGQVLCFEWLTDLVTNQLSGAFNVLCLRQ